MSTQDQISEMISSDFPKSIGRPAHAALTNLGITTLWQLTTYTEKELLAIHGVGPKAIRILKEQLEKNDLALKT